MPRVSARSKRTSEIRRKITLERWENKKKRLEVAASSEAESIPTAAEFRHDLLKSNIRESHVVSDSEVMVVLSLSRLNAIIDLVKCEKGHSVSSKVNFNYFDCSVNIRCEECCDVLHHSEARKSKNSNFSEGNTMLVYHSLTEGYGRAGLSRLSACLGCHEMSSTTFIRHAEYLYKKMDSFYEEKQCLVRQCIEHLYVKDGKQRDDEGDLQVDVCFDGTGLTRGHKSHIGTSFVMEISTGFVLDFEVLSNHCGPCMKAKKSKDKKSFEEWQKTHAEICQMNFIGHSGAVESEAAVRMWGRSQKQGLKFVTFLGDGDSSAFKAVCAMNNGKGPYENVPVVKEECVNHVKKRMGARLRKLKEDLKEEKTTKIGKIIKVSLIGGEHQLTDKQIDAYQRYYGKAIRDSVGTSVINMKLKIMSVFWHSISCDGEGNYFHNHCDSAWCIYKKAIEEGKPLPSHSLMKNYLRVEKKYEDRVREVFRELSSPVLLERCLKSQSQNMNEGLHSKLLLHQNKAKYAGKKRVNFVSQVTVIDHNFGYEANNFFEFIGFTMTSEAVAAKQENAQEKEICSREPPMKKNKVISSRTVCNICNKSFSSKYYLKKHIIKCRETHKKNNSFDRGKELSSTSKESENVNTDCHLDETNENSHENNLLGKLQVKEEIDTVYIVTEENISDEECSCPNAEEMLIKSDVDLQEMYCDVKEENIQNELNDFVKEEHGIDYEDMVF